jgi:hypothetical protein
MTKLPKRKSRGKERMPVEMVGGGPGETIAQGHALPIFPCFIR